VVQGYDKPSIGINLNLNLLCSGVSGFGQCCLSELYPLALAPLDVIKILSLWGSVRFSWILRPSKALSRAFAYHPSADFCVFQTPIPFDNQSIHLLKTVVPPLSSQLVYIWRPPMTYGPCLFTTLEDWNIFTTDCKEQVSFFWSLTACFAVTSDQMSLTSPHPTGPLL
jgi:hypothetical protein